MNPIQPSYLLLVGLGVAVALLFPVARHIKEQRHRRQYYLLQAITLMGAVLGAKLSVLFGDHHWPWQPVEDWRQVFWSGRSITGALILGFVFAELAKPLLRYSLPPNDRFATLLPFTIATGRVGCLLAGCCQGLPFDGWCAVPDGHGVLRHPTVWLEIVFQAGIGVAFLVLLRRGWLRGRLFSVYLIAYGGFRFGTEFLRDTPKWFGGYSGYQLLAVLMVLLGIAFLIKRTVAASESWQAFQLDTARAGPYLH